MIFRFLYPLATCFSTVVASVKFLFSRKASFTRMKAYSLFIKFRLDFFEVTENELKYLKLYEENFDDSLSNCLYNFKISILVTAIDNCFVSRNSRPKVHM